jgi:hypothetical protein
VLQRDRGSVNTAVILIAIVVVIGVAIDVIHNSGSTINSTSIVVIRDYDNVTEH